MTFLQYLEASIWKHFKQWIEQLFFLALFSDQPFSRSVARHICGNKTNSVRANYDYYDQFHKRTINLIHFDTWIRTNVTYSTIMEIRTLHIVRSNYAAIEQIAIGNDIWSNDAPPHLIQLCKQYLEQYLVLLSIASVLAYRI